MIPRVPIRRRLDTGARRLLREVEDLEASFDTDRRFAYPELDATEGRLVEAAARITVLRRLCCEARTAGGRSPRVESGLPSLS